MIEPSRSSGQKILVTGASGFIGSHLCRGLHGGGGEVHAVSRARRATDNGVRWWLGDLADASTVRGLVATIKPDIIFHLASHVAGARDLNLVGPTFRDNLASTVNLLTAAAEVGCRRILLANSMEEPADPEAVASSPYAVAKWAASAYSRMFHALFQLPAVVLRMFMVYGPGQHDVRKLVPYVTLSLLRGEPPQVSSGRRLVDWIYVRDAVEGLLAAARAPHLEGKTVDLGTGQLVSIRGVVEHLVRLVGSRIEPRFGAVAERPLEQARVADVARSTALTGWAPVTTLEDGLRETVEWYRRRATEPVPS